MSEAELFSQLLATTGPIGTLLVGGLMWLRSALRELTAAIEQTRSELKAASDHRSQLDRRLFVVEAQLGLSAYRPPGVPVYNPGQPTPGEGVPR